MSESQTSPGSIILPPKPWVAVAANPYSDGLANKERVAAFVAAIESRGLECRVIWERALRGPLLAHPELARACHCIVAAGGDGTVSDVINDRPPLDVPVAMLPLGTENLFAKQFGHDRGPDALADAIVAGRSRLVDLGEITSDTRNGRRFSLMLSVGADAAVMHRLAAWRTVHPRNLPGAKHLRRVRRSSYASHIFATLFRYQYPSIQVHVDGRVIPGTHAFFFNMPRYGVGLNFAPDARDDDGLLDYIVFQRPGSITALRYVTSVIFNRHRKLKDVVHGRASNVRIDSDTPVPIQMDGETAGFTPVSLTVRPAALRVIVA